MAQDFTEIGIGTVVTRTLLRDNFKAIASAFSGDEPPSNPYVGQPYMDTSSNPWVLKLYKGEPIGWIALTTLTVEAEPLAEFISNLDDRTDISKGAHLIGYRSRTAADEFADRFNVKHLGVKGDGITDDTSKIWDAIEEATADVNNPKPIYFPPGDYLITSLFPQITCKNAIISGAGRGVEYFSPVGINNQGATRIIYDGPDELDGFIFDLYNARGVQISGISFLCNKKCSPIRADLSSNLVLDKLGIFEPYTGIKFKTSCFASTIDNVVIYDCIEDYIVFEKSAHATKIWRCSFASDGGGITTPNSVIRMGDTGPMSSISISGNNFDVWRVPVFIHAKNNYGLDISGNYFEPRDDVLTRYIQLGDQVANTYCRGVNISGNKMFGAAIIGEGVRIEKCYGAGIVGNVFSNMTNAINCANTGESINKAANGIFVAGNRFGSSITGGGLTIDHDYSLNILTSGNSGVNDYASSNAGPALVNCSSTFTPTVAFGGNSDGVEYTVNTGKYQKLDKRVFFTIRIILSSKGTSIGNATIKGLPFANTGSIVQVIDASYVNGFLGLTGAPIAEISTGATEIALHQTTATGRSALTDSHFGSRAVTLNVSGFYEI